MLLYQLVIGAVIVTECYYCTTMCMYAVKVCVYVCACVCICVVYVVYVCIVRNRIRME